MKDTSQALPWNLQAFCQAPPLSPEVEKKDVWEVMGQCDTSEMLKKISFWLPFPIWVELKVLGGDS